jgi:hypothetical protein
VSKNWSIDFLISFVETDHILHLPSQQLENAPEKCPTGPRELRVDKRARGIDKFPESLEVQTTYTIAICDYVSRYDLNDLLRSFNWLWELALW